MVFEQRVNSGQLFRNRDKKTDKHPDLKGEAARRPYANQALLRGLRRGDGGARACELPGNQGLSRRNAGAVQGVPELAGMPAARGWAARAGGRTMTEEAKRIALGTNECSYFIGAERTAPYKRCGGSWQQHDKPVPYVTDPALTAKGEMGQQSACTPNSPRP